MLQSEKIYVSLLVLQRAFGTMPSRSAESQDAARPKILNIEVENA